MAYTDKNILITPNIGSTTDDPKILFSGADSSTTAQNITLYTYPESGGTLSFEGSEGQLFSITNDFTGTIFSVNDVSGIPSIEVEDDGTVKFAEYAGNILIGTDSDDGSNKLQVNGNIYSSGTIRSYVASQSNSGTVTINLDSSNNHNITLTGNSTLSLSNIANNVGVSGNIILQQDATGGRTVTLSSEMKTPLGGASIDFETGANSISALSYYVVSSTVVLVNYIGNFA